uniref:Putative ovule protein n=1 Tax=Solanum chacoense TaxID=4108 RepID=A0A0V0GK73_SOLCH
MVFGNRCIRWIYFCISTVKFSVLVNRSPVGIFFSSKGSQAGRPSLPLFVYSGNGRGAHSNAGKELQWIQGSQVGRNPSTTIIVSYLLYVDDTLIFCGADSPQSQHHSNGFLSVCLVYIPTCSKTILTQ